MKRMSVVIVVLCCALCAIAAGPSQSVSLNLSDPKVEIAKLEDLIAKAKATGQTPDPAWTARIRELIPSIKGHASKAPADLQAFQGEEGFAPGAVIRPTELTPLEAQIKELEFEISGGLSATEIDQVTFANLKEQLNVLYSQRPANRERNPLDQGNSVCPGTVVTGIPYSDSGTTVGMGNEYNPIDPWCNPSASNDVVYEFTPQATQTYNISLQGSSYDCYLYINTGGGCPGTTQVTCNDDFFGLQSFISTTLNAGQTYYIFVDGYSSGREGDYVLNITDNCDVVCQPGDAIECTETVGDFTTDCDGGCNMATPQWQNLTPFQTVCGNGWAVGGGRDTDWYKLSLFEPCSLRITITSEFSTQLAVIDNAVCPYGNIVFGNNWSYPCSTVTFLTSCLQPGDYTIFTASSSFSGVNALRNYRMRVDLVPCSGCQVDSYLQAPGSAAWNTCGAGNNNNLRPSEDYTYAVNIPNAGEWTFSICNDDSIWDSYIYLSGSCNGNVYMQDDDACGGIGLSTINCVYLNPGIYYLTVEGWADSGCGPFVLNVFECYGSCCYGNPEDPACSFIRRTDCDSLGGVWTYMEPCSSGACFTRPTCATAGAYLSQLPMLPDEPWNANLSDVDAAFYNAEDYLVGGPIGSIRFWGVFAEQGACNTNPHNFQITFFDSVNNTSQVYNVTLTGTPKYLQWGTYRILEFSTELNPPCTILNGDVQIAQQGGCSFYWSYAITGYGNPAIAYPTGGTHFDTGTNLAFCLGGECLSPDSVTIEMYPGIPDAYTLRWWQPEGVVHVWWSTSPAAVFPATYSQLISGYVPGGPMNYSFYAPDPSNEIVYVLTVDCSNIAIQNPGGDVPMLQVNQPPVPPQNPVTR